MINKFWSKDTDRRFMKDVPEGFKGMKKLSVLPNTQEKGNESNRIPCSPIKSGSHEGMMLSVLRPWKLAVN